MKKIWLMLLFISSLAHSEIFRLTAMDNEEVKLGSFINAAIICTSCREPMNLENTQELGKSFVIVSTNNEKNSFVVLYRSPLESEVVEFKIGNVSHQLVVENPQLYSKEAHKEGVIVQEVDKDFNWRYFWYQYKWIVVFVIILLLAAHRFLIFPYFKKIEKQRKEKVTKEKIIQYIKNAKTRENFEQVCQYGDEIIKFVKPEFFLEYKGIINQIQFKKNWEEIDLTRALNAKNNLVKKIENGI